MPSPTEFSSASSGSSSRQPAGCRPDCASARTTSQPAAKPSSAPWKCTVVPARKRGRGRTRTQASVTTPRVPSLPSSSRSGLGPAPDAGSRRELQRPVGVTADTASTRSSMWVGPVAKCPAARVAIQPPSVDSAKDCGKNRSVSPCRASCASSTGPDAPPWMCAARDRASTSSTLSMRRVCRTTTGPSTARVSSPPTTDVPPPYGTTVAPTSEAQSSVATTAVGSGGIATTSGAPEKSPRIARTRSR